MMNQPSPTVQQAHRALVDNLKYIALHMLIMFFATAIFDTTIDIPADDFQNFQGQEFFELDILGYVKSTLLATITVIYTRAIVIKLVNPQEITVRESSFLQTSGSEWLRIFLNSLLISLISGLLAVLAFLVILFLFTMIGIGSFAILPEFGSFGVIVALFIVSFLLMIYLSIILSLIEPMLAFDIEARLSLGQIFTRSIGIAHRNFGQLLKVTFVSIGLVLAGILLFVVGLIYTIPLVMVYVHLNYIDIFSRESAQFE